MRDLTENPNRFGLPPVTAITPVSGGVVHHVWRIQTAGGCYFAKIRGNALSGAPGIPCEPNDIEYEARAIQLFKEHAPQHFPESPYCSPEEGLLITTDVVCDGQNLETLLTRRQVTTQIAFRLGETLRYIHERASFVRTPIRGECEEAFCRLKLAHKLGPARHAATPAAVERLTKGCQLILGDPSPKNIAYHHQENRFSFYDLEDAHFGHVSFDTGFLAGHLLLHNYLDLPFAALLVDAFCDGYGHAAIDDLAQFVAVALVHYRLNGLIPYCIVPSDTHRSCLLRNASTILSLLPKQPLPWRAVEELLLDLTPIFTEV